MKRNPNVPAGFDATTGFPIFMAMAHHETHDGDMFCLHSGLLTATTDYLFTVPAGINLHIVFEAVTDTAAAGSLELYPLVTTSAAGSAFSNIFNKKSAGGAATVVTITTGPTVTSTLDATTRSFFGPLNVAGMKAGTLDRDVSEYVLTPGKHLLRVTRGVSGNLALAVNWYEETL